MTVPLAGNPTDSLVTVRSTTPVQTFLGRWTSTPARLIRIALAANPSRDARAARILPLVSAFRVGDVLVGGSWPRYNLHHNFHREKVGGCSGPIFRHSSTNNSSGEAGHES